MRIKFSKGKQREFFKMVLDVSNCPSLRELIRRGFDVSYDCLKNYYSERRTLDLELFEKFCSFAKIDKNVLNFELVEDNFGQVQGGRTKYF